MEFYQQDSFIYDIGRIARQAGELIMEVYDDPKLLNASIQSKDDQSPLTIADQKASDYICQQLQNSYDIPIICEETKNAEYEVRSKYEYVWLVDPLDGTKEFIKRNGEFTVNIGLSRHGYSIFGVVHIPCQNKTYVGVDQVGSFVLEGEDRVKTDINISEVEDDAPTRIVISRSHMNDLTKNFIENYSNSVTVPMGSSIKMLLVADGTADIYPRLGPTMEWDTCAAHAVVKGAGGRIRIFEDNENKGELRYNKENLLNPFFVCSK